MNSVNFTGKIATELVLKTSKNGNSFVPFILNVRTSLKDEDGKYKYMSLKCVVFRTNAELIMMYARKGNLIGISGSLSEGSGTQNYTLNEKGEKVREFKVFVDKLSFLESKADEVLQSDEDKKFMQGLSL